MKFFLMRKITFAPDSAKFHSYFICGSVDIFKLNLASFFVHITFNLARITRFANTPLLKTATKTVVFFCLIPFYVIFFIITRIMEFFSCWTNVKILLAVVIKPFWTKIILIIGFSGRFRFLWDVSFYASFQHSFVNFATVVACVCTD